MRTRLLLLFSLTLMLILGGCAELSSFTSSAAQSVHSQSAPATASTQSFINLKTNSENVAVLTDPNHRAGFSTSEIKSNQKVGITYGDLDASGRATAATAVIDHNLMLSHASSRVQRPSFASWVHLAGEYPDGRYDRMRGTWRRENAGSNNQIMQLPGYRGYIYNKSHLIAWSLGGDMNPHNLILGTRAQNVGSNDTRAPGGMSDPETKIRNALYDQPNLKVRYKVTPIYLKGELVARGTLVQAYSINDHGRAINLYLWIANVQRGVTINYKNGVVTVK